MKIESPFLIALGIGFVDLLPILGSGTVMVPWGIVEIAIGNTVLGVSILCLLIFISLIRQLLEPKIVSNHLGVNPLYTKGYDRVGCWCCPNNNQRAQFLSRIYMPERAKEWREFLIEFAK